MNKKDLAIVAKAVRLVRPISTDTSNHGVRAAHEALDQFVRELADLLGSQRNGFLKRQAFIAACQTGGDPPDRLPHSGGLADSDTQHGRYIDCGPQAWDDSGRGDFDGD